MKNILFLLLVLGLVVSCGNKTSVLSSTDAMKADLVGSWCNQYDKLETMTITTDDYFNTNVCKVYGTFKIGENYTFSVNVTESKVGGPNCMPVGEHQCTYELKNDNNELYLRCQIFSTYYVTTFLKGACS